jgi:hypothetical protein
MNVEIDLDHVVSQLAAMLGDLPERGQAAIFAACGQALRPLLVDFEKRYLITCAEFDPALAVGRSFAMGADKADHSELLARLVDCVPHGHDYDTPWSTYAQDAIICADASLLAASLDCAVDPEWISYALEPLESALSNRDVDLISDPSTGGESLWRQRIPQDPAMRAALTFLRESIVSLRGSHEIDPTKLDELTNNGRVLLPQV